MNLTVQFACASCGHEREFACISRSEFRRIDTLVNHRTHCPECGEALRKDTDND
jgi:predicted RNA-binding Zn-ribbon protein involved in translation (DUF1610 family)